MATNYTTLLGLALPTTGELDGTWGTTVNNSITQLVEDSIAETATASVSVGDWTLTTTGSGAANEARCAILIPTGTPGTSRNIIAPAKSKSYYVINRSDDDVVVKTSASTGVTIAAGAKATVAYDTSISDFVEVAPTGTGGTVTSVAVSGGSTGLTTSGGPITSSGTITLAGTLGVSYGGTGATTASGARTNLALGTIATQDASNVTITGGSISGVSISGLTGYPTLSGSNAFTGTNTFSNVTTFNSSATSSRPVQIGVSGGYSSDWVLFTKAISGGPAAALWAAGTSSSGTAVSLDGTNSTAFHVLATGSSPTSSTTRGTISWTGSVISYGGTSDYRLKENVAPLSDAITKLKNLKPVQFTWIDNPTAGLMDGFIAHEFGEVIPQAVYGQKDAVNADGSIKAQEIDTSHAVPLLTKALQEAIGRIETLEAEVQSLKAQINGG